MMLYFSSTSCLVLFEVIPINSAFSGFGHPAVIIVALVLLISRGLQESGFVGLIGGQLSKIPLSENQFSSHSGNCCRIVLVYEQHWSHGNTTASNHSGVSAK